MKHSESFSALAEALAKAAANFKPIARNRTVEVTMKSGGTYTFTYATLDAIIAAVRPALSAEALVLTQSVVSEEIATTGPNGTEIEREDFLETRLLHSSGEWIANLTPVLIASGENSAQAYGSGITYARRYGVTQLLCIVADEDEDGNAASGNVQRSRASGGRAGAPITAKQVALLEVKLREAGGSEAGLCEFLQVESLAQIPKSQMDAALAAIVDRVPVVFEAAPDARGAGKAAEIARRKAASDEAVKRLGESLEAIRYHLGCERSDGNDLFAVDNGLGERNPAKAADEWREFSEADQHALWLAPTHGGWFTTAEREQLRVEIARTAVNSD